MMANLEFNELVVLSEIVSYRVIKKHKLLILETMLEKLQAIMIV